MSNKIRILDNKTLSEITIIENIISPTVYEEINGSYTFSFDMTHHDARFLVYPNIVEVEGQYFRISRVQKDRNTTVNVHVDCEHISYELILAENEQIEFDDSASGMISEILKGTNFIPGEIMQTAADYYKPSSTSIRQRLFDIANLFEGELIFDNYTVHLVKQRGSDKGLTFELGENLIGVTEEIDNSQGYAITSYEVDVVDLSQVPGYEDFANVEIGDLVSVIDPLIDVNVSYRTLSYERDPFKKINPKIQVGNLLRDYADYIRDEIEKLETEKEVDPAADYMLGTFKVGKIDCLQLDGVEFDYDSVLPDDVSASVDYFITGQHQGVNISLKPAFSKYHVVITKYYNDDTFQEFTLDNYSKSWAFPERGLEVINITVSEVPISEIDLDKHVVKNYGIKFSKNLIDPLREFKIGNVNVLGMGAEIDNDSAIESVEDISTVLEHTAVQKYEGVKLSLKREFKDYHITILTFNKNGTPTIYSYESFKDQLPTLQLPSETIQYFLVTISEAPIGNINPLIHKVVHYGVKFERQTFEPLMDFTIGDIDVLRLDDVLAERKPSSVQPRGVIFFDEYKEFQGIITRLKKEYNSFYTRITSYDFNDKATVVDNPDMYRTYYPREDMRYITVEVLEKPPEIFDAEKHLQAWYSVLFVQNPKEDEEDEEDEEDPNDPTSMYWLETFSIDGVDMLALDGVDTSYGALVEVATIPNNVVITLKEKYREYFTGVFVEQNGKGEKFFFDGDFVNGSLTISSIYTQAFLNGLIRIAISDKPLNTPRADTQSFVVELKLITDTDKDTFLLESLNVDNTEYVNSFGIDEPGGAEETIYDLVKRLRVKVKDDPAITDISVNVSYGETSFNYSKSQFVNGLLSVTPTMPEKVEKGTIEVIIRKGTETFTYKLHLTLHKDDDEESTTGPKYYIESETVTATTAGAQFDFTVPYDEVVSVTLGLGQVEQKETIQAYWTLIQDAADMFTGVKVIIKGLTANSVDVSIQAVVQEGVEVVTIE